MFYWKKRWWLLKMLSILASGCKIKNKKVCFLLISCEWRFRFFMGLVGMFYWEFLGIDLVVMCQ
jgi:hypothetical protein